MAKAAGIYARISQDRTGEALGVRRQVADCEAKAKELGWTVAETYVDDDLSAYGSRPRPGYERMLADIADGHIDAVIVYRLDRLTRQPRDLESFIERCDAAGLSSVATVQGEFDLGTGDGMLIARIQAAVAANESDVKSQRVRRKMDENADAGRPHGGSHRPFGYEDDKVTLRNVEADAVKALASRFLAGESLASLAKWLNHQDTRTSTGKTWRATGVRSLLSSPRIAGLRVHRGEVVGPGNWPSIITPEQSERIRAILADPSRRTTRTARRYLLKTMLRCHACDSVMVAHPQDGVRRYVCKSGPGLSGCGATTISAERVEELVSEAVLYRLDTPKLLAALEGQVTDNALAAELSEQIASDTEQLEDLARLWAARDITVAEWSAARKAIEARQRQAQQRLARLRRHSTLDALAGQGTKLRREWSTLNLDRQRAIVAAILDHAIIGPAKRSGWQRFDPDRVRPIWRL